MEVSSKWCCSVAITNLLQREISEKVIPVCAGLLSIGGLFPWQRNTYILRVFSCRLLRVYYINVPYPQFSIYTETTQCRLPANKSFWDEITFSKNSHSSTKKPMYMHDMSIRAPASNRFRVKEHRLSFRVMHNISPIVRCQMKFYLFYSRFEANSLLLDVATSNSVCKDGVVVFMLWVGILFSLRTRCATRGWSIHLSGACFGDFFCKIN